MPPLLLKISVVENGVTKSLRFDKSMTVFDACRYIRTKCGVNNGERAEKTHGLFLPDHDPARGVWLENGKTMDSYHFKAGTVLEYHTKKRPLRVRTLDEATRTVSIDDSLSVVEIIRVVCARIGIKNPQEFSFTTDSDSFLSTMRKVSKPGPDKKLETLRREKHTHDLLSWVDPQLTLREQGLYEESVVVTLRKKYFFSDKNVDANDPMQLHLLYTQSCGAVSNGVYPVTMSEAIVLAALRCQEMFSDYSEEKFQKGLFRSTLRGLLPAEYRKDVRKLQGNIIQEYQKLAGQDEQTIKFRYIEKCRKLSTYGISFFAVKEKVPRRNKLRPVLLGVKRECVVKLDVKSKEVLDTWELQTIHSYFSTPASFCLNFGAYRGIYVVKTTEGESIVQLLDGYIQLIQQTIRARDDAASPEECKLSTSDPKERMKVVISEVIDSLSLSMKELDTRVSQKKIKHSKKVAIHVSSAKLSASVSALLYSTVTLLQEVIMGSGDLVLISAAAYTIGSSMSSLVDCSSVLAALSLTDKDSVKIIGAVRELSATFVRLLTILQQDDNVREHLQLTIEDVASRSSDLLAIVGLEKGKEFSTYTTARPVLREVTQSVSSFLAQAAKILNSCADDLDSKNGLATGIKDVKMSAQTLDLIFTIISSCMESPLGQVQLVQSTRNVVEAVQKLCLTAKDECLDANLLTEVAGSAYTVTSTLNCLIGLFGTQPLARQRHSLENAFQSIMVESKVIKSLLSRKQSRRLANTHVKAFVAKVKSLLEIIKSYRNSEHLGSEIEANAFLKELLTAVHYLVDLATSEHDGNTSDSVLKQLDVAMSIVHKVVSPYLDHVEETRFLSAVRSTTDCMYNLVSILKHSSGLSTTSSLKDHLLVLCDEMTDIHLNKLYTVQLPSENSYQHHQLLATARECLPQITGLVTSAKSLGGDLAPTHSHLSLELTKWSSYADAQVYELKMLLAKAKFHVPSRLLKGSTEALKSMKATLEQTTGNPPDDSNLVSDDTYFQNCKRLVVSCKLFQSLNSQLLSTFDPVYIYHRLAIEVENIITALGGVGKSREVAKLMTPLALILVELMEQLSAHLLEYDKDDVILVSKIQETSTNLNCAVTNLIDSLPLQKAISLALKEVEQIETDMDNIEIPSSEINPKEVQNELTTADFVTTFLSSILEMSKPSLEVWQAALKDFTSNLKSLVSVGKHNASLCSDSFDRMAMLTKLRLACRSSLRMLHTAMDVVYIPTSYQLLLAPAASSVLSDLNNCLLELSKSTVPGINECEAGISELKMSLVTLDIAKLPSPISGYLETTLDTMEHAMVVRDHLGSLYKADCSGETIRSAPHALSSLADSAKQAASLTIESTLKSSSYHVSSSQLVLWCNQFSGKCERLMDASLSAKQVSVLVADVSNGCESICKALKYAATRLPAAIQKRCLLKIVHSLASSVTTYIDNVKVLHEEKTEQCLSNCKSTLDVVFSEMKCLLNVHSIVNVPTSAAERATDMNIIKSTSKMMSSAVKWLDMTKDSITNQNSVELQSQLDEEVCSLNCQLQAVIKTVWENFPKRTQYQTTLEMLGSLQEKLWLAIINSGHHIDKAADIPSLQTNLKRVSSVCSQVENQVIQLHSFPNVDFLGIKVCAIAQTLPELVDTVVQSTPLFLHCEDELQILNHTTTFTEAMLEIVSIFDALTSGRGNRRLFKYVETSVQTLIDGIEDLSLVTLALSSTKSHVTANILTKAMDEEEIPPFIIEEVDSGLAVHALLLRQCDGLSRAINAMISMSSVKHERLSDLHYCIITSYKDVVKIINNVPGMETDRDEVTYSVQYLGETLSDLLNASGNVQIYPQSMKSKVKLGRCVQSAQEQLSLLVLLTQTNGDGLYMSAVGSMRAVVENIDAACVLSTFGHTSDVDQTDSESTESREPSLEEATALFEAVNSLVQNSEQYSEDTAPACLVAMDALFPYTTFVEKSCYSFQPMELGKLRTTTAVREIATSLAEIILLSTSSSHNGLQSAHLCLSAKIAQNAVALLLDKVKVHDCRHKEVTIQDILNSAIVYLDFLSVDIDNNAITTHLKDVTNADMVQCTSSLSLVSKLLKQAYQSPTIENVRECVILTKASLREAVSVFSSLAWSIREESTDNTEISKTLRECISSIKIVFVELKKKIAKQDFTTIDDANENLENIAFFIGELKVFAGEFKELIGSTTKSTGLQQLFENNPLEGFQLEAGSQSEKVTDAPDGRESFDEGSLNLATLVLDARSALTQFLLCSTSTLHEDEVIVDHEERLRLQSKFQFVSRLNEVTIQDSTNSHDLETSARLVLKTFADVLIMWKAIDFPMHTDMSSVVATMKHLTGALSSQHFRISE